MTKVNVLDLFDKAPQIDVFFNANHQDEEDAPWGIVVDTDFETTPDAVIVTVHFFEDNRTTFTVPEAVVEINDEGEFMFTTDMGQELKAQLMHPVPMTPDDLSTYEIQPV